MKKIATIVYVAMMATLLSAQQSISGSVSTETKETSVETEVTTAGAVIEKKSSIFGDWSIDPEYSYGNATIGVRFGDKDTVPTQTVLGFEAKEMFRFKQLLLGLGFLGQARTNNSEFCMEYADLFVSVGVDIGKFYLGLSPKVNIKTPKGLKIQLDLEFTPVDNCVMYAYGLALINTDDSNKNYVVSGSKWSEGPDSYKEYGGGLGVWYKFDSGCFVSLDSGLFYTNNKFLTKDGAKESISWKTTVKTGGEKLAGVFSYERGGELTSENKPVQRFTVGMQTSF